ncbi:hypothetical protein [Shewanella sp. SM96]|uniref:hypothetical protein n=1 Tax=Shewanella TaxID=22 RepID=UPI0021DB796E|nr:hypothetical protein [Shewanella sp. SM96]MCU8005297.1 hypothetical protein [Shewanella sp. SM96]
MMSDYVINLDEALFAPTLPDSNLADLVNLVLSKWPDGVTCATQESDGAILFWSAPIPEVERARKSACIESGLLPVIGIGAQEDCHYYEINEQAYVANDWQHAVVTEKQFIA